MKKGVFNKRIPTVFAIIALLGILGVSISLVQKGIFYVGKATSSNTPQHVYASNIRDTSFTFSFTTTSKVSSLLIIENLNSGNQIILDDRDKKTGIQKEYYSHYFTVPLLKPNTNYSFKLLVGSDEFKNQDYKVTTGSEIKDNPPIQKPIAGKIILSNGELGEDTIIIAKSATSQLISSITDKSGFFTIPASYLRDQSFSSYIHLQTNSTISIRALRQDNESGIAATYSNAQQLPAIVLGQQYNISSEPTQKPSQNSSFNTLHALPINNSIEILKPREGETFKDSKPSFNGYAFPNKKVRIQIGKEIKQELLSTDKGTWSFRPNSEIAPGKYTLTISSTDKSGRAVILSSQFVILPQGSQILAAQFFPTTSPTIRPTSSPTITPRLNPSPTIQLTSPTITMSLSPTIQNPSPTIGLSITPTVISTTPTQILSISPTRPQPIVGTVATVPLTLLSIFLIIAGTALLFIL